MPLVINGLGDGHAHTHTDAQTKTISRNQAHAAFGRAPGLKSAAVWNRTQDLLYYRHVHGPSIKYACGKLVGYLTSHKRITI